MDMARDLATALDPSLLMEHAGLVPDPWQRDFLRSQAQRILLLCSRQSGKSTTTAVRALHTALYTADSLVLLLSPTLRQSAELFRKVLDVYGALTEPEPRLDDNELKMALANGSRILSLPGKELTVRGYSGVRLIIVDEAARVPDSLYLSVRPMLAVSGGRLVCLSTPFGMRGFFHKEWTDGKNWERVKITAAQCPRITPEFLAEERATMPAPWFRAEYGCEFTNAEDQVFSYDEVMAAMSAEVPPLFPLAGRTQHEAVDARVQPLFGGTS